MTVPLIDVAMVTFGRSDLVARSLTTLSSADFSGRLSITVVDNGSPDGTPEMIESKFPQVRLLRRPDNPGFAVSTNLGLQDSAAPYVLVLNPDTEVTWATVHHLIEQLEAEPDIGVIGCRLVLVDGTFDHASKRFIPSPAQALVYFFSRLFGGKRGNYIAEAIPEDGRGDVDAVNGAFMLIRREALQEVGGLDETFWMYGEDLDWCVRFKQAGWRVSYDGTVTALHIKGGSSNNRRSWKLNYEFHRSMWLFYRKHVAATTVAPLNWLVYLGIWGRCLGLQLQSTALDSVSRLRESP